MNQLSASSQQALAGLYGLFASPTDWPGFTEVAAEAVPAPYDRLLVHEHHMTVTVEAHHGERVKLRPLEECHQDRSYARKIMLLLESSGRPVQFGIMRIHFDYCDEAVRDEILKKQTPLGRILIEHNVLRRIEPTAFLRVVPNAAMMAYFEIKASSPTYGRLAIIHCDHKPAVELLEIVAPE